MAFCAMTARPAEKIDQAMQGHIPAVAFMLLAMLGDLIWACQQRGARAGGDEKGEKGTKINVSRRLVHDRERRQPEKPQQLITPYYGNTPAVHENERVCYRARARRARALEAVQRPYPP
jgi:hypothetical protein